MALVNCPECRQAVSTQAEACPNCGYVLPKIEPAIVRNHIEHPDERPIPKWVIIPAIAMVAITFLIIIVLLRNNDSSANKNIELEVSNTNKRSLNDETAAKRTERDTSSQIVVPSNPTVVSQPTPAYSGNPQTEPIQRSEQTVAANPNEKVKVTDSNKGEVKIDAKVLTKTGTQAVKNEKFYLLDKDLETILSKADLEPIESNSLTNSLGLSIMFPERYGQFNRKALEAIKNHVKYSVLTDTNGKASIKDVDPDSYYLFGITKSKTGFAVWSSSVNINNGENILNLAPAQFNEVDKNSNAQNYDEILNDKGEDE